MASRPELDVTPSTLPEQIRARAVPAWVQRAAPIAAAVALIAVAARIAVPIPGTPVPVTLQDLVVLAVGIVLGPRRGALAVASYVLLGAAGAPVFSNGRGGIAWLMGPTGGYLLAFPVAAAVAGWAARPRRLLPFLFGLPCAVATIFTGGVLQLALVSGAGIGAALATGFLPFLPGITFKSALVVAFFLGWTRLREPAERSQG